ncbi:hypothetical protein ABIB73_004640 [Bradyrhizobium sp. F1.4.3]
MPGQKREARLRADVPGIHALHAARQDVDGRVKPGHDGVERLCPSQGSARSSSARMSPLSSSTAPYMLAWLLARRVAANSSA